MTQDPPDPNAHRSRENRENTPSYPPLTVRPERGSFLVAGAVFMLLFMGVAALTIDVSHYFYKDMKLQSIADGAVLSGAQAFDQRTNDPDFQEVRLRILRYIEQHQGPEYVDLYEVESDTYIEGIEVAAHHSEELAENTVCVPDHDINGGNLQLNEPTQLKTNFIGSAITDADGNKYPVTSKFTIRDDRGNTSDTAPWGSYNDYEEGNLNQDKYFPPTTIEVSSDSNTVNVWGQSWEPDGDHYLEVSTRPDEENSGNVKVLKNGDPVPNLEGAYDQDDVVVYLENYIDESGNVQIAPNQVIVLFELGTTDLDSDVADFQDAVILLSLNTPPGESGSDDGGGDTVTEGDQLACDGTYYRAGASVYDGFYPHFVPEYFAEMLPQAMVASAVAEARPKYMEDDEVVRKDPLGRIHSSPPYTYEDPDDVNVGPYYGVGETSSTGCGYSYRYISCQTSTQLIDNLGNDIRLDDQVLHLRSGFFEVDPSESGAVHSLRGSGYVLVEGGGNAILIDEDGSTPGVINGELDLVALDGSIKFDEFSEDYALRSYLMAPNGEIIFGGNLNTGISIEVVGGMYSGSGFGGQGEDDVDVEVSAENFCPSTARSEICEVISVIKPGSTPYTWSISLVH